MSAQVKSTPKKNIVKTQTVQIKSEYSFGSPYQPIDSPKER